MRSAYPAVFLCALACASGPSSSRLSTTGAQSVAPAFASSSTSRPGRGVILTGSFSTEYFSGETLFDVLRLRAPLYLRPRPIPGQEFIGGGGDPVAVYIDNNFAGGYEPLQSIPAYAVFSVDRISATEAAMKFGPRHSNGAILVRLVRR